MRRIPALNGLRQRQQQRHGMCRLLLLLLCMVVAALSSEQSQEQQHTQKSEQQPQHEQQQYQQNEQQNEHHDPPVNTVNTAATTTKHADETAVEHDVRDDHISEKMDETPQRTETANANHEVDPADAAHTEEVERVKETTQPERKSKPVSVQQERHSEEAAEERSSTPVPDDEDPAQQEDRRQEHVSTTNGEEVRFTENASERGQNEIKDENDSADDESNSPPQDEWKRTEGDDSDSQAKTEPGSQKESAHESSEGGERANTETAEEQRDQRKRDELPENHATAGNEDAASGHAEGDAAAADDKDLNPNIDGGSPVQDDEIREHTRTRDEEQQETRKPEAVRHEAPVVTEAHVQEEDSRPVAEGEAASVDEDPMKMAETVPPNPAVEAQEVESEETKQEAKQDTTQEETTTKVEPQKEEAQRNENHPSEEAATTSANDVDEGDVEVVNATEPIPSLSEHEGETAQVNDEPQKSQSTEVSTHEADTNIDETAKGQQDKASNEPSRPVDGATAATGTVMHNETETAQGKVDPRQQPDVAVEDEKNGVDGATEESVDSAKNTETEVSAGEAITEATESQQKQSPTEDATATSTEADDSQAASGNEGQESNADSDQKSTQDLPVKEKKPAAEGSMASFFEKASSQGSGGFQAMLQQAEVLQQADKPVAKPTRPDPKKDEVAELAQLKVLAKDKVYEGKWGIPNTEQAQTDVDYLFSLLFESYWNGSNTTERVPLGTHQMKLSNSPRESSATVSNSSSQDTNQTTSQADTDGQPPADTADRSVNSEFVEGLDDISKLFEAVDTPDELDVGASGSSIHEVLMGQGKQILLKRIRALYKAIQATMIRMKERIASSIWDEDGELRFNQDDLLVVLGRAKEVAQNLASTITELVQDLVAKAEELGLAFGGGSDGGDDDESDEFDEDVQNTMEMIQKMRNLQLDTDSGAGPEE